MNLILNLCDQNKCTGIYIIQDFRDPNDPISNK